MNNDYYKQMEPFWGYWRICDFIGEGSYGKVFKIEKKDISGNYYAAMKVLSIRQSNDIIESVRVPEASRSNYSEQCRNIAKNMANEFKLMEQLKGNSNIVCYEDHEIREYNDGLDFDIFIRMELLTPVNEHFKKNAPCEADIIRLGIDICKALETCAIHNILHRDVKPGNIFISKNNNYKLGDFGVARTMEKANRELSKKGTYDYMAPEVYKGEIYGASADVFSLGIVLYKYMNNGRIPFLPPMPVAITPNDEDIALGKRLKFEEVPLPCNASTEFGRVISKACAGDLNKRYQSATELRKDLEKLLNPNTIIVDPSMPDDDSTVVIDKLSSKDNTMEEDDGTVVITNDVQFDAGDSTIVINADKPQTNSTKIRPKGKKVLIIVAIIAVLLALLVSAIFLLSRLTEKDNEQGILVQNDSVSELVETWKITDYEEEYPFYAIETKYIDGEGTDETRVNTEITKYTEDEAKIYYFEGNNGEQSKRILYIDGIISEYIEYVDEMSDEEWVIEGCDSEYHEYARKYINGKKTDETEYTGVIYDKYIYIASDGSLFYAVYCNGKVISYMPATEIGNDWVVDGKTYEKDSYKEIAIRYIEGVQTTETKLTGRIYDTFIYTVKNSENDKKGNYYKILYVNGNPTDKKEYINELSEEEWLISGYDAYYQEYAILYKNGFADTETRYTGKTVVIEEWKTEQANGYYYERKFVNGVATNECRNYVLIQATSQQPQPVQQTPAQPAPTFPQTTPHTSSQSLINQFQPTQQTPAQSVPTQPQVTPTTPSQTPPSQSTVETSPTTPTASPTPEQPQTPVVAYTAEVLDKAKYAWYLVSYDANGNEISRTYLKAAYRKTDIRGNEVWS